MKKKRKKIAVTKKYSKKTERDNKKFCISTVKRNQKSVKRTQKSRRMQNKNSVLKNIITKTVRMQRNEKGQVSTFE